MASVWQEVARVLRMRLHCPSLVAQLLDPTRLPASGMAHHVCTSRAYADGEMPDSPERVAQIEAGTGVCRALLHSLCSTQR